MKLTDLHINAFGVWKDLHLTEFSPDLNVIYGPNEAGKTTLMQFIRAVLYGFSPERRKRYFASLHEEHAPGGSLFFQQFAGKFRLQRRSWHDGPEAGELQVWKALGSDWFNEVDDAEEELQQCLHGIDETTYSNVFALGLRELQELNTLTDIQAADHLYQLALGVECLPLPVLKSRLDESAEALLAPPETRCRINDLLEQRGRIQAQIRNLREQTRHYLRVQTKLDSLAAAIDQRQQQIKTWEEETGRLELLQTVLPLWQQRGELEGLIGETANLPQLPQNALATWEKLSGKLAAKRQRYENAKAEASRLKTEIKNRQIDQDLLKAGPQIDVLAWQINWVQTLKGRVKELRHETGSLRASLDEKRNELGLGDQADLPLISSPAIRALSPLVQTAAQSRQKYQKAKAASMRAKRTAKQLGKQLTGSNPTDDPKQLPQNLQQAKDLVQQLRKRKELETHLATLQADYENRSAETGQAFQGIFLPIWLLVLLFAVFGLGVMMLLGSFLSVIPTWAGWPPTIIGFVGIVASLAGKALWDYVMDRRIQAATEEFDVLHSKVAQAREALKKFEESLPPGEGSYADRLKQAEEHVQRLEKLSPLEERRKKVEQEAKDNKAKAMQAMADYRSNSRRWKKAIKDLGLSADLKPKQLQEMADGFDRANHLRERLSNRQYELDYESTWLQQFLAQLNAILSELGLPPTEDFEGTVKDLAEKLREHRLAARELRQAKRNWQTLRRRQKVAAKYVKRYELRAQRWLKQQGVKNEEQLRHVAEQLAERSQLQGELAEVDRQIDEVVKGKLPRRELEQTLEILPEEKITERQEVLKEEFQAARTELSALHEKRGELKTQLQQLRDDRALSDQQLELAQVEAKIRKSLVQWHAHAAAGEILTGIQQEYEQHRQPETLQRASEYFRHLSGGRYRRVWTPMTERKLLVEQSNGETLPIELLSRGTREQLFLCLRLALIGRYSEQGIELPMVLDDLLVNFDQRRAALAADLLVRFAGQGHQLLVFTCHEHIAALFRQRECALRSLPDRFAEHSPGLLPGTTVADSAPWEKFEGEEPTPFAETGTQSDAEEHDSPTSIRLNHTHRPHTEAKQGENKNGSGFPKAD